MLVLAVLAALVLLAPDAGARPGRGRGHQRGNSSVQLQRAVTVDGILEHEEALQAIADANAGTRASGTPGYEASVDYVVDQLEDAGYDPEVQSFTFPFFQILAPTVFEQTAPDTRVFVEGADFATPDFSGSGDVSGSVQPVNDNVLPPGPEANTSNAGCEPEDFTGFTSGNVALIQRGSCTFGQKVANADDAGAAAVILFNEGQPGRTGADGVTLGGPVDIPVVFASFDVGNDLAGQIADGDDVQVHIVTQTLSEERETWNVIADARGGRTDRTVLVGAHLDSVLAGPGINDNGSGSSTILEVAQELAEGRFHSPNHVRFAWWGAEEAGLLGSTEYVATRSQDELDDIALNLNFDMVASPNRVRFVYDGDGDETGTAGPEGSGQIEDVFERYFAARGLATDPTAFDGRSDYGPFIDVGIPAGGLFTGAEGLKTDDQAATYGGTAGEPYDPCYHQACDTTANLAHDVLDQMADAVAHSTWVWSHRSLPPRSGAESVATEATTAATAREGHVPAS